MRTGRRTRRGVLTLLAAALWAASAGAQETPQARARSVLQPEIYNRVEALARALESEGLPAEPIYNKALEGVAKRVPQDRLLPALDGYAGRLRMARSALGPETDVAMLVAGADAIQRGVGPEALGRLNARERHSPMAVLVLADLVETGVPTDEALDVLHEAMRRRMGEQEMMGISGRVRALMGQGRSPQEAMEQVRRMMQRRGGGDLTAPVAPGAEPLTRGRRRGG